MKLFLIFLSLIYLVNGQFENQKKRQESVIVNGENVLNVDTYPDGVKFSQNLRGDIILENDNGGNISITTSEFRLNNDLRRQIKSYIDTSLTSRFKILNNLKRGNALLCDHAKKNIQKLLEPLIQKISIKIDDETINLENTAKVERSDGKIIYHPEGRDDVSIIMDNEGSVDIQSPEGSKIEVRIKAGLTASDLKWIRNKIHEIASERASLTTGISKHLLQFMTADKNIVDDYLGSGFSPYEKIQVDGKEIDLKTAEILQQNDEFTIYKPEDGIEITKYANGTLFLTSNNGKKINVASNTGLPNNFLNEIVGQTQNYLRSQISYLNHKANKDLAIPANGLRPFANSLINSMQKPIVRADEKRVDLDNSTILESNDIYVTYQQKEAPRTKVSLYTNGGVSVSGDEGKQVSVLLPSGMPEGKISEFIRRFSSAVGGRVRDVGILPQQVIDSLSDNDNRDISAMARTLLPSEEFKVNGERINLNDIKPEENDHQRTYTVNGAVIQKNDDGGATISSSSGESILLDRSSGVEKRFVDKLFTSLRQISTVGSSNKMGINQIELIKLLETKISDAVGKRVAVINNEVINPKDLIVDEVSEDGTAILRSGINSLGRLALYSNGSVSLFNAPGEDTKERFDIRSQPGITIEQSKKLMDIIRDMLKGKTNYRINNPEGKFDDLTMTRTQMKYMYPISREISPTEQIYVNDELIDLSKANVEQNNDLSTIYQPVEDKNVKITKFKNGGLAVESLDGSPIQVDFSTGMKAGLAYNITKILQDTLDNKFKFFNLASLPAIKLRELMKNIQQETQKERILVNNVPINLRKANIIGTSEFSTVFQPTELSDITLTKFSNGTISASTNEGGNIHLKIEKQPGLSEDQVATLWRNIQNVIIDNVKQNVKGIPNQIWNFIETRPQTLLNAANKFGFMQNLIKLTSDMPIRSTLDAMVQFAPRRRLSISGEKVDINSLPLIESNENYDIYKGSDDVTLNLTKDGDIMVRSGMGIPVTLDVSSGVLSAFGKAFTGTTSSLINNKMNMLKSFLEVDLRSILGHEIKLMKDIMRQAEELVSDLAKTVTQKEEITVNGEVVDMDKAKLVEENEDNKVYEPEGFPNVRITKYNDGKISVLSTSGDSVSVSVSSGLRSNQFKFLKDNFHKFIGNELNKLKIIPAMFSNIILRAKTNVLKKLTNNIAKNELIIRNDVDVDLNDTDITEFDTYSEIIPKESDVKIQKGKDNSMTVSAKGGSMTVYKSSGLTPKYIAETGSRISKSIRGLLQRINQKGNIGLQGNALLSGYTTFVNELENFPSLLKDAMQQSVTISVNGQVIDLSIARIVEQTDSFTMYRPDEFPNVRITMYNNGTISTATDDGDESEISIKLSYGLTSSQVDQLMENIKDLVPSFNPMRLMMSYLLNPGIDSVKNLLPNFRPSLPQISMPKLPSFSLPSLPSFPSISLPSVSLPSISLPSVSLPSISLPSISLPFSRPSVSLPSFSF